MAFKTIKHACFGLNSTQKVLEWVKMSHYFLEIASAYFFFTIRNSYN